MKQFRVWLMFGVVLGCMISLGAGDNQATTLRCNDVFEWRDVYAKVPNTVVQVFTYGAEFNWVEPYKTPQQRAVAGSGFFIDESGLIITNAHVVDQAVACYIQIPHFGKRRFDVEILGVSPAPERDLALLRVIPEDLAIIKAELGSIPYLTFGNSDDIRRADEIMTLGYPLTQQTLKSTVGVVSGRQFIEGRSMIQIDAPINPGNSGGPSLNKKGQVIGVNSAGIFESGAQNIGYIISSSEVQLFLKQLEEVTVAGDGVKFLRKPFLGIQYCNGSDSIAQYLHNPPGQGLYVAYVCKDSPFDKAGVQAGDMLYELDDYSIDYFGEINVSWSEDKVTLLEYVGRLMVGSKLTAIIYRNGERLKKTINFDLSKLAPIRMKYPSYEFIDYEVVGGLVVMELALNHLPIFLQYNTQLVEYIKLENQAESALIITHILPDSEASKTRSLLDATIIKEINGEKVKTLQEFRKVVTKSLTSGFLTLKTEDEVFVALPFARVLKDEPKLASTYFYRMTHFVRDLLKKMGVDKRKV